VRRLGWTAWLLLALALAVRFAALETEFAPVLDPADYDRHGVAIANTGAFPDTTVAPAGGPSALRPPTYPYFLGGVYKASRLVTDDRIAAARAVQAVLGVLTVALIGLIAFQLWGRRPAIAALAIAAVFPPLISVGASLISENVFLPLELGAVAAVLRFRGGPAAYRWVVLAGALTGLAILARSNGAVLLLPLALGVWTRRPVLSRRALAAPVALLAAAAVTIVPWTIRNAMVMDEFIPVSTQAGFALSGVYNDTTRNATEYPGAFRPPELDPEFAPLFARRDLDEVQLERELRKRVRDYIREHPLYVLEAGGRNALRMLHITDGLSYARLNAGDVGLAPRWGNAGVWGFYVVALLALAGALSPVARRAPLFLWLTPALLFATVVVVGAFIRYRAPVDPFVVLLASLAVAWLWDRVSPAGGGRTVAAEGERGVQAEK
jgi:4-amino-4-deoxy-L-arabinose transferase-like glycosyltransferase